MGLAGGILITCELSRYQQVLLNLSSVETRVLAVGRFGHLRNNYMWRRLLLLSVCIVAAIGSARLVPPKNSFDGVLDANIVVIVKSAPTQSSSFLVDEVFLGDARVGDLIRLKDFRLETIQEDGPAKIDPITPATRILLFLRHAKNDDKDWEIVYSTSTYWSDRPQEIEQLRDRARRAVQLRRDWEAAAQIDAPALRVAALWPYLSMQDYGLVFFEHTKAELKKTSPAAGVYFAEHFKDMSHNERMSLLPDAGDFGSNQLRQTIKKDIDEQRHVYVAFVDSLGRLPKDSDWNGTEPPPRNAIGEIDYGLWGLAKFRNREDLPFIRETAVWAVKYHQEQTAKAALKGFQLMPDRANLPAIEQIQHEFNTGSDKVLIENNVEAALCAHVYPETADFRVSRCR